MAVVKKFPQSPYFDDFAEDNNFLRVLFRPGYAVQTRELNQIQTIMQDQIGLMGDYALSNNIRASGGEINIIKKLPYVKLSDDVLGFDVDSYIGAKFSTANGLTGTILRIEESDVNTGDPTTLYLSYTSSSSNGESQHIADNSDIDIEFVGGGTTVIKARGTNATGFGSGVVLNAGAFFIDKSFIRTSRQVLLLSKYTEIDKSFPETSVGFLVESFIIRPEENLDLLDNATGAPNETAPGAHRYKGTISLINRADVRADDISGYVELMRIVKGNVASKPHVDNDHAVLQQTLARRTYDQSGDYVVDGFNIDVVEHLERTPGDGGEYSALDGGLSDHLLIKVDTGVAYVRGYEVRSPGTARINLPKARDVDVAENVILQTQYKSNLIIYNVTGIPKLSARIQLKDTDDIVIGVAHIRAFEYKGETLINGVLEKIYQLDLNDVMFDVGGSWSLVNKIDYTPLTSATYQLTADVHDFNYDASEARSVYKLPFDCAQSINPRVSFFNKEVSTMSVDNKVVLATGSSVEEFDDEISSFTVYVDYDGGKFGIPQSVTVVNAQSVELDITNITGTATPGNVPVSVVAKTYCRAPVHKTKTLVSGFTNSAAAAARVKLSKADIYELTSVTVAGSTTPIDITDSYYLDSGARDAHYEFGSIILRPGVPVPEGTLTITFSYFEHAGSGDFFTVASYSSMEYENIPSYTTSRGEEIFLGSAIDYRPRRTSVGNLSNTGRHSFVSNQQLIMDITYYLPRNDRLMLTHNGEFKLISGIPSNQPKLPTEVDNAITMYNINVAPYTFGERNITVTKVNHRRYTMRDISKLDDRLSNVEEVVLLNALERSVKEDDYGDRFKSGFVVDDMKSNIAADMGNPDFAIAYDIINYEARPKNVSTFSEFGKTSTTNNIAYHTDGTITLDYTEVPMISQTLASGIVRIQPFISNDWLGNMFMNPPTDIWFDQQEYVQNTVNDTLTTVTYDMDTGRTTQNSTTSSRSNWTRETNGVKTFDTQTISGVWNFVNGSWRQGNVNATDEQTTQLNNIARRHNEDGRPPSTRISLSSDSQPIPYIRARAVEYFADGLRPNTRMYATFDGRSVNSYIQPAGKAYGDPIITNGAGIAAGVFNIPGGIFKTGDRVFKLSDNNATDGSYDSTFADFTYTAEGTLKRDLAWGEVNTSTVIQRNIWSDPVAQSFLVETGDDTGGTMIASIDLFLANMPEVPVHGITVEIRRIVNGYPAGAPLGPHAVAYKPASELVGTGSQDASNATNFKFNSPVHINDNEEYAFVVLSNSETAALWISELGQRSYLDGDLMEPTGEVISKQPYLGSMFVSQNSTTWSAEQTKDVKFTINRCEFVSDGQFEFVNNVKAIQAMTPNNLHRRLLQNHPLHFTAGSLGVYVSGWGHGLSVGDKFRITRMTPITSYFGTPTSEVHNVWHTVTDVDIFGFTFEVNTAPTATGRNGGNDAYIDGWVVEYSYAQLVTDEFIPMFTGTQYTFQPRSKQDYASGLRNGRNINANEISDLKGLYVVKSNDAVDYKLTVSLSSDQSTLSPILNEHRVGLNLMSNVINNKPILDVNGDRQDKSSPARYVQRAVSLLNPANELKVLINANIPSGSSVNVYYKVGQVDVEEQLDWIKLPVEGALQLTDDINSMRTQRFSKEFTTEFQVFTVLVELVSSDSSRVPRFTDYRALALNV